MTSPADRPVDVESDAADGDDDDEDVENVPEALEVLQLVLLDLEELLDHVVEDEEREDRLARHDEVVPRSDVADQLHRAEVPRRNGTASRREFDQQSACRSACQYVTLIACI